MIDIFKHDPDYETNEEKYQAVKKEIIGDEADDLQYSEDENNESDSSGSDDEEKGILLNYFFSVLKK